MAARTPISGYQALRRAWPAWLGGADAYHQYHPSESPRSATLPTSSTTQLYSTGAGILANAGLAGTPSPN